MKENKWKKRFKEVKKVAIKIRAGRKFKRIKSAVLVSEKLVKFIKIFFEVLSYINMELTCLWLSWLGAVNMVASK